MPIFSRGETTIHYEVHGSGYPVLLFAPGGMRSCIALWERSPFHPVREFSDQFRMIAMDQRNAGASRAKISAQDGWHSYTEDHLALLDELGVERCHVLGMCIGCAFSLALLTASPERVAAAVLLQSVGHDGTNREVFYQLFDSWAADLRLERDDISSADLPPFRERMFGGDFVFSTTRDALEKSAAPLLVLRGNDVYHPPQTSEELARLAPHGELIRNWKTGDDVAPAVARVRAFLTEH
jgi:pimeloyl-ACP methyl ester carboxylesterase